MNVNDSDPLVSVIMPVYNAELFLHEAIRSILDQSYRNIEFIIINDGSTDKSVDIIKLFLSDDDRIIFINRNNKGMVQSLNEAIFISKGKYIARMDADDISLNGRINKQVEFLELNPSIDVLGCDYFLIDSSGIIKGMVNVPKTNNEIFMTLCNSVPFAHPSVMIRKTIFDQHKYNESYVEDYWLWASCFNGSNFANLSDTLFLYRHNYGLSFSDKKRIEMLDEEKSVNKFFFDKYIREIGDLILKSETVDSFTSQGMANIFLRSNSYFIMSKLIKKPKFISKFIFYILRMYVRNLYWKIQK